MFRNLNLSTKILAVLTPLFVLTVGTIVAFNYTYQEMTALNQAKSSATLQAMTIKEALVDQMITNYSVDRKFLQRVGKAADVKDLDVWFFTDSLKLMEEYRTPVRMKRLRESEMKITGNNIFHAREVFRTGEARWLLTCSLGKHEDELLGEDSRPPGFLQTCEELKAVVPFTAEKKCQECHGVEVNDVLGAATMTIPLARTTAALHRSAIESVYIFLGFSVMTLAIGFVVYRRFVAQPLKNLVKATEILGEGNLDTEIVHRFDHDEFGKLAASFEEMQARLKTIQNQLVHKERLSTVGQMASSIIHDFRSPMTGIMLAIDRLQKPNALDRNQRDQLFSVVKSSIERMNRMMVELLDYSRGDLRLNPTECNVREFMGGVERMIDMDLEGKEISFSSETVYDGKALVDCDRLQRALLNVLTNAGDATPKGGEIRMITSCVDGLLIFRIQDTGKGIPPEARARIFEPFATFGKKRGTGLGLAITKRIVEEHYGEIDFQSTVDVGTTFVIKVPLKPPFEKKEAV